ncbi:MAG TPA: SIMPL domain-containing protein [Mycobacterium sp.]|jgi:hypothetical protein
MSSTANKTRLRRFFGLFAAAIAVAGLSACGSGSNSPTDARQVTVVGNGHVQGTPDTLTVNVGFESTAPDATTAMNQTSQRTQSVIDALVNTAKIDRKDISTTSVNLQPQFGQDSSTITGYRASNSLAVKIRKLDSSSQALALITTTGGNSTRFNSIDYSIDDDSQLVKDARARAFDDAKARAEQYAQLSGLHLGKVISISENGAGTPPPTPMPRSMAAAPVPVEPGQQTVNFAVNVVWELT